MPKSKSTTLPPLQLFKISFLTLLLFLFFLSLPGQNVYEPPFLLTNASQIITLPPPSQLPLNTNKILPPQLTSQGALIIDLDSQVTLFEKNANNKFAPASTTKIVTALVALRHYQLEDILEVKSVITEGRLMGLFAGEKISAENLVMGALIHSGNDATIALADNYPGGVNAFVGEMNKLVASYGLTDTHFTNPVGFEDPQHYTTARDLAQITRIALHDPRIKKIISTKLITVPDEDYVHFHTLENVNTLLGKVPGIAGVKTGWTQEAGEVLTTLVKRDGHDVVLVLLKSQDRFGETERLVNWVFANFRWVDLSPLTTTQ